MYFIFVCFFQRKKWKIVFLIQYLRQEDIQYLFFFINVKMSFKIREGEYQVFIFLLVFILGKKLISFKGILEYQNLGGFYFYWKKLIMVNLIYFYFCSLIQILFGYLFLEFLFLVELWFFLFIMCVQKLFFYYWECFVVC